MWLLMIKKSLMPLPAMCSVSPVYDELIGARKKDVCMMVLEEVWK